MGRVRWASAGALESPTSPRPSPPPRAEREISSSRLIVSNTPRIFSITSHSKIGSPDSLAGRFPGCGPRLRWSEARVARHRAQWPASLPDRRNPPRISQLYADDENRFGSLSSHNSRHRRLSASVMSCRKRRASVVRIRTLTRSASGWRHTRRAARRQPGSARCGRGGARGSGSSPSLPR